MRVPLSWLKDYVDISLSPEELAHTLTMAGLEVEGIEYIGATWGDKIITAQIDHLEKVEGSDHLNYTKINTGSEQINVICGAPNIKLGDKVPLALPGAQVGDITISETRKFGYVSQGMLCSPSELGMGNDHSGIYILEPATELGQPLVNLLGEVVFDFSIKAHRGDLSSIIGIAREVAALTKQPLRIPQPHVQEQGTPTKELVRVTVEDSELCPRYTARVISNVQVAPSPNWMAQRLLAAGMRPINNVVDITNYVLLEFGQPLHGFDYDLVPEHHVIVRRAHEGEVLTTLDDVKRKLSPSMLLITDINGPTAIAGVMGGAVSEISAKTTSVLLEAANFKAGNVRRTSTLLGLRTDASTHFEKGLDPELTLAGANRAAQLLAELAGGNVHPGIVDHYPQPAQARMLDFSVEDVEWYTSMKVTQSEAIDALTALHFTVVASEDGKSMQVTVPTYRSDVKESADLVEEVIRLIGYDRIPSTIPDGPLPALSQDRWFEREQEVRSLAVGAGLNEIITYTLTSRTRMAKVLAQVDGASATALLQVSGRSVAQTQATLAASNVVTDSADFDIRSIPAVTLVNPLSSDMDVMRLTLLSNLLETVQENSKHNKAGLRFFELGRRYLPGEDKQQLPEERRTIGVALCGPAENTWLPELSHAADFYDLKGVIETLLEGLKITHYRFASTQHPTFHPGRTALVELGQEDAAGEINYIPVGVIGEVHPLVQQRYDLPYRAYLAELDLEQIYAVIPTQIAYQPISRHQELTRDLALVVDQKIPAQTIQEQIARHGGELLRSVTLFDVYTGDPIPAGKKNLTYTLVYQATNRTLKDTEANELQERIIRLLHEDFGAVLR
ncbi:phenylalanine--tRNA ligase subunit beta [Dictyobacter arantiisoli]|uniref:Phenylalanine--tRNA ligase beta subunit n=1 Tax=Dictyobacter arantiisoli TaxID=2014874 RepID=A0A5A5TE90_9CHLR|nr:phenylalanine--tRNA ligase subunit beta [Dictyobacter arantiisoli]GCF09329.1 phenylalanine--tRNA ligase beta subunit [Dictyobacter arantiisoli]